MAQDILYEVRLLADTIWDGQRAEPEDLLLLTRDFIEAGNLYAGFTGSGWHDGVYKSIAIVAVHPDGRLKFIEG